MIGFERACEILAHTGTE